MLKAPSPSTATESAQLEALPRPQAPVVVSAAASSAPIVSRLPLPVPFPGTQLDADDNSSSEEESIGSGLAGALARFQKQGAIKGTFGPVRSYSGDRSSDGRGGNWRLLNTLPAPDAFEPLLTALDNFNTLKKSLRKKYFKSQHLPSYNSIKNDIQKILSKLYYLECKRNPETAEQYFPHVATGPMFEAVTGKKIAGVKSGHHHHSVAAYNLVSKL